MVAARSSETGGPLGALGRPALSGLLRSPNELDDAS